MENKSKVLDKIRKLLTLAADPNASEGEIENALKFAQTLMMKHEIEQGDVEMSIDDIAVEEVDDLWKHGDSRVWLMNLLAVIGKSYNCKILRSGCYNDCFYKIIGFADDRKLTKEVFLATVPIVRNLIKSRYRAHCKNNPNKIGRVKFTISYQTGFVVGLQQKLKQERDSILKLDQEGAKYELIVIKKDDIIKDWIDRSLKVKSLPSKKFEIDHDAFSQGISDGENQSSTNKQLL